MLLLRNVCITDWESLEKGNTMKKMIMAVAMFCIAGAASAVTMTWSSMAGKATDQNGMYSTRSVGFNLGKQAGAITAAGIPPSGLVALESIVFAARSNNADQTATTVILRQGDTVVASADVDYSATETVTISYTAAGTGYAVERKKITVSFDGVAIDVTKDYTLEFYNGDSSVAFGYSVVKNDMDGNPNWMPAMEINLSSVTVPEPTTLALLALGVAGMALRRKAV